MEGLSDGRGPRPVNASPGEVRTDRKSVVPSMIGFAGIPVLQGGEDVNGISFRMFQLFSVFEHILSV
jgi:hypothetical protein